MERWYPASMLWYFLSPLRGTTLPPRLEANHPIRRAFYRHGRTTAQHWLVAMLVTVAIAMGFSYPTIFLAENPTAGFAAYPHHVWTTAKPLDGDSNQADVEMRQVWVHGSYMKALEKEALINALDIQQTLVGKEPLTSIFPRLDEKLRSSTLTWGYHSPLMYWNNSRDAIENDKDILGTINAKARDTSSSLNVALRPASVFAGKKFHHQNLVAADALVITLMNKVEGNVGVEWQDRTTSLATGACKDCLLFPRDGRITRSRVYEFSFTPLSVQENIALAFAYGCMVLYVLLSLNKLKAFHSRFGLVVTAVTQMTCSILASFTICGILKINLSMIPQNAYPFVILVMGIENMFRIINAVLAYPATTATELRIANALGDVGPVSVLTAIQNTTILAILSRVVSPGVAAFCIFACIATLFDTFFLLTFFVAVLNVDIRRFELQDALARANQSRHRRKPSPAQQHSWFDALVHGRLPFSTRMAGTAVMTTFILSLNYHFFEHQEKATNLRHLLRLIKDGPPMLNEFDTFAPPPINASLTPGQWMRMQDFDTAKEVMRLAKPGADSFIVRVFAPLIVVLAGADRTQIKQETWTTALREFAIGHFYPVAVAIVFAVAFVAVLMNFLLYTEHEDADPDVEIEDALKVQTLQLPHRLDIIKMSASDKGHLVSVGLDRTIAISVLDRAQQTQRTIVLPTEALAGIQWPIHSITIDDSGEWIACHCADDQILTYCCSLHAFVNKPLAYPDDNPPVLFQFLRLPTTEGSKLHFLVLTSGGRFGTLNVETGETVTKRIAEVPLLGASVQELSSQGRRLLVATDQADLLSYSWTNGEWIPGVSQLLPVATLHGRITGAVKMERDLDLASDILVITISRAVLFLDSQSLSCLGKLEANDTAFSRVILGQSTQCKHCGSPSFRCVTLVGEVSYGGECTITTLRAKGADDAPVCLKAATPSCCSFEKAERTKHTVSKPGAWAAVTSQAVLGLRRMDVPNESNTQPDRRSSASRLRRRRQARSKIQPDDDEDVWEAYKLSLDGELETTEVVSNESPGPDVEASLYVSNAGPAVPLDGHSVAVAFGNSLKIIKSARRGSTSRRTTGRTLERQPIKSKNS